MTNKRKEVNDQQDGKYKAEYTFSTIPWKETEDKISTENLNEYSKLLAKGELDFKGRMEFARLVLECEIKGHVAQSFFVDVEERLKGTISTY